MVPKRCHGRGEEDGRLSMNQGGKIGDKGREQEGKKTGCALQAS